MYHVNLLHSALLRGSPQRTIPSYRRQGWTPPLSVLLPINDYKVASIACRVGVGVVTVHSQLVPHVLKEALQLCAWDHVDIPSTPVRVENSCVWMLWCNGIESIMFYGCVLSCIAPGCGRGRDHTRVPLTTARKTACG